MGWKLPNNAAGALLSSFLGYIKPIAVKRRPKTFLKPFDPVINRHTGKPHEHKREIARKEKARLRVNINREKRAGWMIRNGMKLPDGDAGLSRSGMFIGSEA